MRTGNDDDNNVVLLIPQIGLARMRIYSERLWRVLQGVEERYGWDTHAMAALTPSECSEMATLIQNMSDLLMTWTSTSKVLLKIGQATDDDLVQGTFLDDL